MLAKKCDFNGLPAYEEGPFVMVKLPDDGLWYVYHKESNIPSMGELNPFVQKKDALTFVSELCNTNIDWNFKGRDEMGKINSYQDLNSQLAPIFKKRF